MMTEADLQAVADLTIEAFPGASVKPHIHLKKARGGWCSYVTQNITIPEWTQACGESYIIYYVVHEVCHLLDFKDRHGAQFQRIEDKALKLWGIRIDRLRVYPKRLYLNGQKVYERRC